MKPRQIPRLFKNKNEREQVHAGRIQGMNRNGEFFEFRLWLHTVLLQWAFRVMPESYEKATFGVTVLPYVENWKSIRAEAARDPQIVQKQK